MADSAPKIAAKEHRESLVSIEKKASTLARQIAKSKHFIVFTGAGISTSAGIPDFRGPDGSWTLRAQGRTRTKQINTLQAIPTLSHMALVELQNRGILKYIVSQNCDGLHRRCGISADKISELHGNSNRELCIKCSKEYIRDFRAVSTYANSIHDHRTDRKCVCGGQLHDTIINFGENLPVEPQRLAIEHAQRADLCLVLGSSLTVTPANEIPEIVGQRKKADAKLAICNLQDTPIDELCALRIWHESDTLMAKVMEEMKLPIPTFILHRHLKIKVETQQVGTLYRLTALGIDSDGKTAVTFIQSLKLDGTRRGVRSEPFALSIREALVPGASQLKLELEFMGHYNEPNVELTHLYRGDEEVMYLLNYNPQTGKWTVSIQDGGLDQIPCSLPGVS